MDSSSKKKQKITNSFENFLKNSKRSPNLFETDRGKEFYDNNFENSLDNNSIKQ